MANTLDLIIKLVVQNQDAVKKLGEDLKALGGISIPDLGLEVLEDLVSGLANAIALSEDLVENLGSNLENSLMSSTDAIRDLIDQAQDIPLPNDNPSDPVDSREIDNLAQALGIARNEAESLRGELSLPDESILRAIDALRQFSAIDMPIDEQFAALNQSLGVTAADFDRLSRVVFPKVPSIDSSGYKDAIGDTVRLAERLGISSAESKKLQQSLNLPTDKIELALAKLQQFESVDLPLEDQFRALNKELGVSQGQFDRLKNIKINPQGVEEARSGLGRVFDTASRISFGFNNITQSIQTMIASARPAYDYLIGANEKLNQQLLQSAASITATSAVSGADGVQLKNIDSIRALQPKLKETIREVEIATQSLVGVTSEQTSEVFNVILTNTGQLNGQLKSATGNAERFKDPLDAAAKLAPGLVATLGTMGLPISQAADEVGNLLKGEIDQSAQVAKSLGITREMIESWKAQGVLVDKLTQKFDPFLKANAEAARSVGGITSNIQDMFEIIGREAGKPLTEGFVTALQSVYEVLQKVMPSVQKVFTDIIAQSVTVAQKVAESIGPSFQGIGVAIGAIAPAIGPVLQSIIQNFGNLVSTLKPISEFLGVEIGSIGVAIGALLPVAVELNNTLSSTFQGVVSIIVGVLGPALFVVGEAFKFVAGAIAAISADPIGKVIIQGLALAAIIAPIAVQVIALGAAISALAGTVGGMTALGAVLVSFAPGLASTIVTVVGFGTKAAAAFGTAQLFLGPIVAAFTTGGLSAGIGAASVAVAGLGASFATAAAAAAPLLLALAPLFVIGGAIAVTLAVKGAKDLENVQTELDDLRKTTNDISDNALKNAQKLKALADAAASGGLSAEQKQQQKDLIFGSKQQLKLIDDQIAAIKKQKQESQGQGASQEQLNQFDAQQKQLENTQKTLSKYADAVKIASQELANLGTANEQIAQKVKAAQGIIDGGVGDPARFKESAKLLSDLTQKQVELGTITAEQGAKTLAKLQNNTKLDYESQLAAKEAIVKIYQSRFAKIDELQSAGKLSNASAEQELEQVQRNGDLEFKTRQEAGKKIIALKKETLDAELAESAAATAKLEAQKAKGEIGEAEAARQTSKIKVEESQKRLELQKKEAELETNPEVKRKLVADVAKTEAEISKIKADEINRRNAERLKDFDEEEKLNQAALETGKVSEETYNSQKRSIDQKKSAEEIAQLTEKLGKLKSTDKEGREAIEAQIAEAQTKREQALKAANDREIATLQNRLDKELALVRAAEAEKNLEIARSVKDGSKSREQGDIEAAKAAAESAEKAIAAEEEKLDKLRALPRPNNPKDAEAFDKQIADQQAKSSQSRIDLLKKQGEIEKALIAEVAKANQKANEEIEKSQQEATIARNSDEVAQLKAKGADVEAIARATTKQELDRERAAATEKYALKQEELTKLKALIESGQLSPDQAIEAERKLQKELGDINLQRIGLEKKALEALRAEKVRLIELESQNSTNAVQKKLDILNAQKTVLEQQNTLLSAQDRLESASFNLAKQRTGFAIEDAKAAKDETLVKQLEMQAAADQLTFTRQQNISKIESIQLSLEQKAIDAAMAALNAEIATIQSQANLQKAIAEGKSKEVIAALTREVELRGKQELLTAKAAENQKTIGGKELAAARIEAKTAEERDIRAYNKAAESGGGTPIVTQAATPTRYQPGATADKIESKNKAIDKLTPEESASAQRLVDAIAKSISGEGKGDVPTDGKAKKPTIGPDGKPLLEPIVDPAKSEAEKKAIEANQALGKSTIEAANAVSKFGNAVGAVKPLPTRFAGGPVAARESFIGAELGPELAKHTDGSYQMLMLPGIYNLDRSAQIIPAHETQQILKEASMMTTTIGSTQTIGIDNRELIHEMRLLRSIVTNRRPTMNVPVTFEAPASDGVDRKMAEFSRMLVRSGL